MMRLRRPVLALVSLFLALHSSGCRRTPNQPNASQQETNEQQQEAVAAKKAEKLKDVLWEERDTASLDLFHGAGGKLHAPNAGDSFRFVREDLDATSPKFHVEDGSGTRWIVKLGEEARPETAAARLVWAMGYFVDEQYYVRRIRVSGMPKLERGHPSVFLDGTVMD